MKPMGMGRGGSIFQHDVESVGPLPLRVVWLLVVTARAGVHLDLNHSSLSNLLRQNVKCSGLYEECIGTSSHFQ
jgi:hypothetical protein